MENSAHKLHSTETSNETFRVKSFGLWSYLMTDFMLFASLFATFIVLRAGAYFGKTSSELFDLNFVLVETMVLLVSSFTVGMSVILARAGRGKQSIAWLIATLLLGALFLGLELYEFNALVAEGAGWWTSGFMSSYFVLVGTHGAHIAVGLIWGAVVTFRLLQRKFRPTDVNRLALFSVFWHFLDVVWIFIFTIVYLMGVIS